MIRAQPQKDLSFPLRIYCFGMQLFRPLAGLVLRYRARAGKEDETRLRERYGFASLPRPDGRLIWLHGASVGESVALLPLVERLSEMGMNVLVTSGTVSSAKIMTQRLGPRARHQFLPLDVPVFIERFLDHWRPDLALFVESEIWPNFILATRRRAIPLFLANAHMSPRSFERWQYAPATIRLLLNCFEQCLAQGETDAQRLRALGAPRVQVCGNLKYDGSPPPADPYDQAVLEGWIGSRPVWLAASTHYGEEILAGRVHQRLQARFPDLLTLIAPRHPHRGKEILADLRPLALEIAMRSQAEAIEAGTQIYLADTIGEMGILYRLSPIAFIGKSLAAGVTGGHSPIEAAKTGCAVIYGPHIENVSALYADLNALGGAIRVEDEGMLADRLADLLEDTALLRRSGRQSLQAVNQITGTLDRIMVVLEPFLQTLARERH